MANSVDERLGEVNWYGQKQERSIKEFYALLNRKFSDDKDIVKTHLDEIISQYGKITWMLARANAELDFWTHKAFKDPTVPPAVHGKGKERDAAVEDICAPYRYLRDVLEGLEKAATHKINFGKILIKNADGN